MKASLSTLVLLAVVFLSCNVSAIKLKACTKIGCGAPAAGPDCVNVITTHPNGRGCGSCQVCMDESLRRELPKSCTMRGCGAPPAGPDCVNVRTFYPNGRGCGSCKTCMDDVMPKITEVQRCTMMGCGAPRAGPECENVFTWYPNGEGCGECTMCLKP